MDSTDGKFEDILTAGVRTAQLVAAGARVASDVAGAVLTLCRSGSDDRDDQRGVSNAGSAAGRPGAAAAPALESIEYKCTRDHEFGPPVEVALPSSQKSKRRRQLSGSQSADAPRKKRTPPGRINAPRQQNGRFLKLSEGRTGKSLDLVRKHLDVEDSTENTSDSPDNAFTMPLPSELVNEIYNICIMPHLKTDCMSEMEVLVRKNLFIKHYRPQLILFLASAHSGTTYKSLDALVAAAIRKLGF